MDYWKILILRTLVAQFLNLRVQILWFDLICFPDLVMIQKVMVIRNHNLITNTIDRQWPCQQHFYDNSPPSWDSTYPLRSLLLWIYPTHVIRYNCGSSRYFWAIYCETAAFYLSTKVRRFQWCWETTGDSLSHTASHIQIVYIYYIQLNVILNIYSLHHDYFYG